MIRNTIYIILLFVFACSQNPYYSERTKEKNRSEFHYKLIHEVIGSCYGTNPLEKDWSGAFWAMYAFDIRNDTTRAMIENCLTVYPQLNNDQKYGFLQALITLYPVDYKEEVKELMKSETSGKLYSLAAQLILNQPEYIKENMPYDPFTEHLNLLSQQIDYHNNKVFKSHISEFLKSELFRNKKHIVSFQPVNRDYAGLAVVINADGEIDKDNNGNMIFYRQLARSASNTAYYLTNGNSPAGLYSIQNISVSENVFIGPVPLLELCMPYECNPASFYHQPGLADKWTLDVYINSLPEILQAYTPAFETFYAGKCGRTEIVLHGTTINPEYFRNKPFYPMTPSLGCITSYEIWNETTGKLMESDQLKLINRYKSLDGENGYFLLLNASHENKNIQPKKVYSIIN